MSARRMTLLDCIGLGINGIIGSGIFLLPAKVFLKSGGASWAAWFAVGGVCLLVGLCFGEAAGMTDRNGGPYAYAREAFGEWVAVGVGWMAFVATLFAYGAVARAVGRNLSYLAPALQNEAAQIALALAVIAVLALINLRGVKPGAIASDLFSGAKLIPILFFVGVGLFFVDWSRVSAPAPGGATGMSALRYGGLAALFACTGFEYVPVPAGETGNPRRNVPLALIASLFGSVLLYALVQLVFVGTHPSPATADKPLAEAAAAFLGPWAGGFVAVGAVISSLGFLTGTALVAPRYLAALSDDGALPAFFSRRHAKYDTPAVAIWFSAAVAALLGIFWDFDKLSDLNNAAVFAQYVPTCLAVLVLRIKQPDAPRGFKLPMGPVIPVLATLGCLTFITGIEGRDALFATAMLVVGLVLHAAYRAARPAVRPAA